MRHWIYQVVSDVRWRVYTIIVTVYKLVYNKKCKNLLRRHTFRRMKRQPLKIRKNLQIVNLIFNLKGWYKNKQWCTTGQCRISNPRRNWRLLNTCPWRMANRPTNSCSKSLVFRKTQSKCAEKSGSLLFFKSQQEMLERMWRNANLCVS